MIMDLTTLFSDGQAITADAASTNVIDLGATGTIYGYSSAMVRDVGPGSTVPLVVTVTEAFDNLTSIAISVQTDSSAAFGSPKTVWGPMTYALADLAVGAKYLLPDALPVGTDERYVRLYYDVTGTTPTTGKITAGVVLARQTNTR